MTADQRDADAGRVPLTTIAGLWLRIGSTSFGGPPAHITLLRRLCVRQRRWISDREFEDGLAATNLLPGPASTQLAIYCAWRLRGTPGALVGGLCFIVPGLVAVLALSVVLLADAPNRFVLGAAAGAGAAVAAVALDAAAALVPASWRRAGARTGTRTGAGSGAGARWLVYLAAGVVAAALLGAWLVVVLLVAGLIETLVRRAVRPDRSAAILPVALPFVSAGGLATLCWVAFKVGALSYGGGFVIIPLMQSDAVDHYHWMTDSQFLYAVALGQITPGPVVHTVAAVGYSAAGIGGGLLAAVVAFGPSFLLVTLGARHFDQLRANVGVRAFLTGAAPAAIGAIGGSAILLGLAITHLWQVAVLVLAVAWLFVLRRGVVTALLGAAALGLLAAVAGWPVE